MSANSADSLRVVEQTSIIMIVLVCQTCHDGREHSTSVGTDFVKLVSDNLVFICCKGVTHQNCV
jgi:hypothetical protein